MGLGKTGTLNWRSFSSLLLFKIYLVSITVRRWSWYTQITLFFFWRCASRRWFSVKNAHRAYLEWTTETKQEKIPFQMKKLLLTCSWQNYFHIYIYIWPWQNRWEIMAVFNNISQVSQFPSLHEQRLNSLVLFYSFMNLTSCLNYKYI